MSIETQIATMEGFIREHELTLKDMIERRDVLLDAIPIVERDLKAYKAKLEVVKISR